MIKRHVNAAGEMMTNVYIHVFSSITSVCQICLDLKWSTTMWAKTGSLPGRSILSKALVFSIIFTPRLWLHFFWRGLKIKLAEYKFRIFRFRADLLQSVLAFLCYADSFSHIWIVVIYFYMIKIEKGVNPGFVTGNTSDKWAALFS